jgi:hypothetical protein
VVIGWTDPECSRPFLSAFLLGYYDPDGKLVYAAASAPASILPSLGRYDGGGR